MDIRELVVECGSLEAEGERLLRVMKGLGKAARQLEERAKAVDAREEELARDRAELEKERQLFVAECQSVRALKAQGEDRIVLEVGGRHFTTTRKILCAAPDSM